MSWNLCQYEDCEAYTARPDGQWCETHRRAIVKQEQDEKKATEKRKALLSKPKKIYAKPNKVSEKRKELNKEYSKLAKQFKVDHPECEIKANEFCTIITEDVHHGAGRIGLNLLNMKRWKAACRSCHNYAHDHPKEAFDKGWSESRLATTEPHKI